MNQLLDSTTDAPTTQRPIIHRANADRTGSLCGAPVIGVLVYADIECVVCAGLTNVTPAPRSARSIKAKLRRAISLFKHRQPT